MSQSWKTLLLGAPELGDFANWPQLDPASLPAPKRRAFLRNLKAVQLLLQGESMTTVARLTQYSPASLSRKMRRCLTDFGDGPALTAALIPHRCCKPGRRRLPLPTQAAPSGARGSLDYVLQRYPVIRDQLDRAIKADQAGSPRAERLSPRGFHARFLLLLREQQHPLNQWPYTSASLGYETLRKYLVVRQLALQEAKIHVQPAQRPARASSRSAYVIEIDAHVTDVHTSVAIAFEQRVQPLRIGRITQLSAVDADSTGTLAYNTVLKREPDQYDLLRLLRALLVPHQRRQLSTPQLSYPPHAGFASERDPSICQRQIALIRFDNALINLASGVRQFVCCQLGAVFHAGRPGQPKTRNAVEYAFQRLERSLHRNDASTGSHPADPNRESARNAKQPPQLTLVALEDMIEVIVAAENGSSVGALAGYSRNDALLAQHQGNWQCLRDLQDCQTLAAGLNAETVTVHWYRHENRLPFINFEHVRYNGAALNHADLAGKKILIKFDSDDIRYLEAYRLTGEYLGRLAAPESWLRFRHGLSTRKLIHHLVESHKLQAGDPLASYFAYLLANGNKESTARELIRVSREFGLTTTAEAGAIQPPHLAPLSTTKPATLSWREQVKERSP